MLEKGPDFFISNSKKALNTRLSEGLEKMALESVLFINTLIINELHLQQIES